MSSEAEPRWLEISLTVDGEQAEAVADVLSRYTTQGVVIESGVIIRNADDEGAPYGPLRVYGYIPFDDGIEQVRRQVEESLWHLGQISPLPSPVYKPIHDANWMEAWKDHYQPIPVGQRMMIVPAWIDVDTQGRLPIRIDPGMAFGTGTHPSTQLCLELLERWIERSQTVLDIGCGSGILSIGAIKLGAHKALAVDIDPQAVRSTRENAALNSVEDSIETGKGSVYEILSGEYSVSAGEMVIANILAPVLRSMLLEQNLAETVAPEGVLILAGILDSQASELEAIAGEKGLRPLDRAQSEDWVALAFRKL